MPKSYNERLAALEALEALPGPSVEALGCAALDDAALLDAAVLGLRTREIIPAVTLGYVGVDAYWTAIAARVVDYCIAHDCWLIPASPDEVQAVCAALEAGTVLADWPANRCCGWYTIDQSRLYVVDVLAFPRTPLGTAVEHVNLALNVYAEHARVSYPLGTYGYPWPWEMPELPADGVSVVALLQSWYGETEDVCATHAA